MQLSPYLSFNGNCEEAFKLYERVLGGKIVFMWPYEGSPAASQAPPEWQDKIMHATLQLEGQSIMAFDATPGHFKPAAGIVLSIGLSDPKEAERIFNALAEGGKVSMPLEKTFWAERFGVLTDRFGIPWMINCEQPR